MKYEIYEISVNIKTELSTVRITRSNRTVDIFIFNKNSSKIEKLMLQIEIAIVAKEMNFTGILLESTGAIKWSSIQCPHNANATP